MTAWRREAYAVAVALLVAMALGSVLIMAVGQSPARVYGAMLAGTWGDAAGISQVLFKTTPLIFTGLSVALAFRAGLFNIGAEGQAVAGAMATAVVAAALPQGTPAVVALPIALVAGLGGGAVVGGIPGALKAWTGAHEVINTIMLNFIVAGVVLWLGNEGLFEAGTTHTRAIVPGAELPRIGAEGSAVNASLLVAVAAAAAVWLFLERTTVGFRWRAVGDNPGAAEAAGISPRRAVIGAMATSGALAGLVGANSVLGYKHYFEEGMSSGVGFVGIAVALLGRNHPAGVVVAALTFGTLSHGGFAISQLVPREITEVLQAVVILALVAASAEVRRLAARGGRR